MSAAPAMADLYRITVPGDGATAIDARSARSFARHTHDDFGIGVMTGGAQRSWSGRGPVEAISGNLITVNPGEMHDGAPVGTSRSWSMLYLSPSLIGSIVADLSEGRVTTQELHAPVVDDPPLAGLLWTARAAAAANHEAAFEETLTGLIARLFGPIAPRGTAVDRRVQRVRERIDADPAGHHPLAELAALADLSRFHTLRAFTRLTGLPPHAYVTQRRLQVARGLMRAGLSPAAAASDAGFADQSHLHRLFATRYGYTPGRYAAAFRARAAISCKKALPPRR